MTPDERKQLARETAEKFVYAVWDTDCEARRKYCKQLEALILTKLEQVSREERKEAEALRLRMVEIDSLIGYCESAKYFKSDSDINNWRQGLLAYVEQARAALAAWKEKA